MTADEKRPYESINERRHDKAFMARLAQRMQEDAALMERLKDGECRSARLIESRQGGTVLVYECECGARLTRTKAQAEADAQPDGNDHFRTGGAE